VFSLDPDALRNTSVSIDEIDRPFSVEEISKTISSLQRHKSADYNNNVSDFLLIPIFFIPPYLVDVFNKIFESGVYPDDWCKGVIVTIHKRVTH